MSTLNNNNSHEIDYNNKVLDVKGLKKYFFVGVGKNKLTIPAVDDVTFHIYKREVFGLVGESGCGKTTTGRTIMKLYTPTEGGVDLNGITISGGFHGNLNNIKILKKDLKDKINSLNPLKKEIISIITERDRKIDLLKFDLNLLNVEIQKDIKKLEKEKEEFDNLIYKLKNEYVVDVRNIQYQASLEKSNLYSLTINNSERQYKLEKAILKNTYLRKSQGIKESAALQKETISKKLEELSLHNKISIQKLEELYKPLIEVDKQNMIHKDEYKKSVEKVELEKKSMILTRKESYKNDLNAIVPPNFLDLKNRIADRKQKYKEQALSISNEIKKVKNEAKLKISLIKKESNLKVSYEDKEKISILKAEINALISEEIEQIKNIKVINNSLDTLKVSRNMQMIFQDPISSLNPRMTVKEIIGEGLIIQNNFSKQEIENRVNEVLELVGLSREYATRYPHEFSGGQRQRIGIARALIMNPDVIIADEPISALDVSIRAQIINLLQDLKERLGLTILFIAHDLSVVRFFCDRIAVMYAGKIVEMGTSKDIFSNPLHPYTKSLLSAIPQPDPDYEKNRKRINYNPNLSEYRDDKPSLREIAKGHFIYVNEKEFKEISNNLKSNIKE
jgi:oligopeptide transport system ATP-binding protein